MTATATTTEVAWLSSVPGDVGAKIGSLPSGLRRLLLSDPTCHESQRELFRDACMLHRAGIANEERLAFLELKYAQYYRTIEPREFERVIENSTHADERDSPKYPPKNDETVADALSTTEGSVATLMSLSPIPGAGSLTSGTVIDLLFPDAKLLCLATRKETSITQGRQAFAGIEEQSQFMVPNEMGSEFGMNQAGRMSPRCNENVGRQVFQVIEFDRGTLDEQARIHLHLKSRGVPLAMVVFSGGKSLHGWFRCDRIGGANLSKFLHYAAALGADKATFVPCQLVRTPNAFRDSGVKQEVLYLDPKAGL